MKKQDNIHTSKLKHYHEYLKKKKWEGFYYLFTDGSRNETATARAIWDPQKYYGFKYKIEPIINIGKYILCRILCNIQSG